MDLTLEEFKSKYFYKTELVKMCREWGLPTYGTKAELNQYIIRYLSGIAASDIKQKRRPVSGKALSVEEITVDTPLVGSGFKFNKAARSFFCNYLGKSKFSFTKSMAVTMRKAEVENDTSVTVGDLIHLVKDGGSIVSPGTPEEATYQWNTFVKDFCADPANQHYVNKLKVAAILWKKVRNSNTSKKYSHGLLNKYASILNEIKKGDS